MSPHDDHSSMSSGQGRFRWLLLQVAVLAAGLAVAAATSKLAVARLWTYAAESLPEAFPWGTPMTEENARTFEEVMGFLILALLICPVTNGLLLPWLLRTRPGKS